MKYMSDPAIMIDYKVVTLPTIANVKEGMSLLSFYAGSDRKADKQFKLFKTPG